MVHVLRVTLLLTYLTLHSRHDSGNSCRARELEASAASCAVTCLGADERPELVQVVAQFGPTLNDCAIGRVALTGVGHMYM